MLHRRMHRLGETKAEPEFLKTTFYYCRRGVDLHTERGQNSADPLLLVMLRFPCFATGIPQAAATIAALVLTLKSADPTPPVPQVSTTPAQCESAACAAAWRVPRQ